MADRSVAIRLTAHVQGVVAGFKTAGKAAEDFGSRTMGAISKNSQHINTLSNQVGAFGLAAVAAAGLAVKRFADFDEAMSNVAATGDDARDSIDQLRDAAIDAGARTKFSASEAANAIEEMAKAGVSAADILGGGLDGALDLAAAGNLGVAEAAGIASVALKQFKLDGEDVSHVADLLAAGAGKAMGDVTDLGAALRQAGQVASATGLSIEETTAGLAAFASAGLLGSDAGTSFKAMLQRLTPQSAEAQRKMDELGISAYDAQGQFIGLEAFAGNLEGALKDLTPEARNAALATIFGSDAVRAANVLYEEGAEGIAEWTEKVDDSGYAAEVAAVRMDNLKGDIEEFTGSLETAFIKTGEGANGPLRSLVQSATDVVNAFSDAPTAVQNVTLALVGGGGLIALGVAGLGKLVVGITETKAALTALGISGKTATLAVAGVGTALGIAAVGLTIWAQRAAEARARTEAFQDTLDEFGNVTDQTLSKINESLSEDRNDWLANLFGKDAESLIDKAKRLGLAVEDLQGYILGEADAIDRVTAATDAYLEANDSTVSDRNQAELVIGSVVNVLDEESRALTDAEKAAAQKAAADEAAGVAAEDVAESYATTTTVIEDQVDALEGLLEAQREQAGVVLSQREAQRGYEASLDAATEAIKKSVEAGMSQAEMLDVSTEAGRANQSALDDIAESGRDLIDSMRENGASQEELQAAMQRSRDDVVAFGIAMGMSEEDANSLADELKLIPSEVPITVVTNTAEATAQIEAFRLKYAGKSIGEISMQIRLDAPNLSAAQVAEATRYTGAAAAYLNKPPRASGGAVTGGKQYLVGENGPEIVTMAGSGVVTNAAASRAQYTNVGYQPGGGSGPAAMGGFGGYQFGDVSIVAADPRAAMSEFDAHLRFKMAGRPA